VYYFIDDDSYDYDDTYDDGIMMNNIHDPCRSVHVWSYPCGTRAV
jgi:hypothetical protein